LPHRDRPAWWTPPLASYRLGPSLSEGAIARQKSLRATLRTTHMKPIAKVAKQQLRDARELASSSLHTT
jgi:hypothetical protein